MQLVILKRGAMMRVLNFVAGFLLGVAMAMIAVLLTTPQSGNDLQVKLRVRFDEILAEGRRAAAVRRAELEERLASLKSGG
jgi:gas vesicle protein